MNRSRFLGILLLALVFLAGLLLGGCKQKAQPNLTSAKKGAHAYVVAQNGSDKNPGSAERPWRTIQHAADKVIAGDKVYIRDGVYKESVQIKKNGSAEAYIEFSAYPSEKPVIDGTGVTDWNNGVSIDKSSYIKLAGIEVREWKDNGMIISNSSHLVISDCVLNNVGGGVQLLDGSHDFEFNRVKAHNFDLFGFDASPGDGGAPCYNGTFTDCVARTGRDRDQNVDGFALGHGNQHDFKLKRCKVYDVFDGFDMSASNTVVSECSVHDCRNAGFKLWQDNITVVNCLAYHNEVANVIRTYNGVPGIATLQNSTFVDAGTFNISIETTDNSLRMYNCILAGGKNIGLGFEKKSAKNYEGDYNLFQNDGDRLFSVGYEEEYSEKELAKWRASTGQDEHSIVATSLGQIFVDPKNFDLHLLENSPAIDKGRSDGAPSKDYDGRKRPQGNVCDIGAYER